MKIRKRKKGTLCFIIKTFLTCKVGLEMFSYIKINGIRIIQKTCFGRPCRAC